MDQYLLVALGGALGAVGRHAVYNLAQMLRVFAPWATLAINGLGALLIGVAYVTMVERAGLPPALQPLLSVGFLGAFTTYSTYSLDAWRLLEQGQPVWAVSYLLGTLVLCIAATGAGLMVGRALSG